MRTRAPIHRTLAALTLGLALSASVLLGVPQADAQETQVTADYLVFVNGLSGPSQGIDTAILTDVDLIRGNNDDEAVNFPGGTFEIFNGYFTFEQPQPGDTVDEFGRVVRTGESSVTVTFNDGSTLSNVLALRDFSTFNFGTTVNRYLLDQRALGARSLADVADVTFERNLEHNLNWDDLGFRETAVPPPPPPNETPVGRSDGYVARSGETLTVSAANGVLANDFDPDGDPLTAAIALAPANSTINLNADGSFTFRANRNFTGLTVGTYEISDGRDTRRVSARFVVQPTSPTNNPAPIAVDDQYAATAGQTTTTLTVNRWLGANDVYAEPGILSYELVSATPGLDVVIEAPGRVSITPDISLSGQASVDYRVSDGFQSDIGTAFVTVQGVVGPPPTTTPPTTQPPPTTAPPTTIPPTTAPPTTTPPTTAPPTTQPPPTTAPPTTQPPTTQPPAPEGGTVLFSLVANQGGFADEDIVEFDPATGDTSVLFDGSDVGLSRLDIKAFAEMADGSFLITLNRDVRLGGVTVLRNDILRFTPTSLGSNTAGRFSIFLDGSDVGLGSSSERIDAIDVISEDGGSVTLAISTVGSIRVSGVSGADEDLSALTLTRTGSSSQGTWARFFDGSDLGLTNRSEDVAAAAVGGGELRFVTQGSFSASGASGTASDVVSCDGFSAGGNTSCGDVSVDFNVSAAGLSGARIDGLDVRS